MRGAGTRLRDATVKAHNRTRISGALHPAAESHPSASRRNLFRPPRARVGVRIAGAGLAFIDHYIALVQPLLMEVIRDSCIGSRRQDQL